MTGTECTRRLPEPGTRAQTESAKPVLSREQHTHRLLAELEAGNGVSQRRLSAQLGIALGLTNLLVRNLVRRGWVQVAHARPDRVRYLLTPAGFAQKARLTRVHLSNAVRYYAETRDRVRERLAVLSVAGPWSATGLDESTSSKRIVFYGGGEVAEIGYLCLQETDLTLVGVVDDAIPRFFGVPVHPIAELGPDALGGTSYDVVVVMSFLGVEKIRRRLEKRGLPASRVFWI